MLSRVGLVFVSMLTGSTSMGPGSVENLILCLDVTINQGILEYKEWLQSTVSMLKDPLQRKKGSKSTLQKKLIEEITLATDKLQAVKIEEWLHQLAVMNTGF